MEFNYLKVFYEVAKAGSFTEAAKRLHISQSALSRSVALLEESEGIQLFERSKRGVALTKMGDEIFRHCETLFQTMHKISEVSRGRTEACEGPLRFATPDHVINDLLIDPIQSFRGDYPDVIPSVSIGTPDEVIATLHREECEFALLFVKVTLPQINYEPIREEPMSLVVSSDVWAECRASNHSATLNRVLEKVGYISSVGARLQPRPSRVLSELFGRMPRIGFEVSSQEAQKRICMAGGGVAYLARFMVEREIRSGQLHEINVNNPHVFKLWLATLKGHQLSLPAKMFTERLRETWK